MYSNSVIIVHSHTTSLSVFSVEFFFYQPTKIAEKKKLREKERFGYIVITGLISVQQLILLFIYINTIRELFNTRSYVLRIRIHV